MGLKEIIEGNKLIAEFMGAHYDSTMTDYWFNIPKECLRNWSSPFAPKTTDLQFHSSYDWIMPVVEKIEQLLFPNDVFYNIHILGGCCVCIISSDMDELGQYSEPTKILTVFKAIVEYIKWYNVQNK